MQAATQIKGLHAFIHASASRHAAVEIRILQAARFCKEVRGTAASPAVGMQSRSLLQQSIAAACGTFGSHVPSVFTVTRVERDLTCLVSPPVQQLARLDVLTLQAADSSEPANSVLEEVVAFINSACNCALLTDGSVSPVFAHKRRIESTFGSTPPVPPAAKAAARSLPSKCSTPQCWLEGYKNISATAARCPSVDISSMSPQTFMREVLLAHTPVKLVGGGVQHWTATEMWGPRHLKETVGKSEVHVKVAPGGVFEGSEGALAWVCPEGPCLGLNGTEGVPAHIRSKMESPHRVVSRPAVADMPVSRLLKLMAGSQAMRAAGHPPLHTPSFYVEYLSMSSSLHALWQDLRMDSGNCGSAADGVLCRLARQLHLAHANVWIGDGRTTGKAHFDAFENLLVPIAGAKEVFLWPPYNASQLYEGHMREAHWRFASPGEGEPSSDAPHDWLPVRTRQGLTEATSMVNTPVDVQSPDLDAYPFFRDAIANVHVCRADAGAGEAIFLPAFWWHEVLSEPKQQATSSDDGNLEHNLAVNFWYKPLVRRNFPCRDCSWELDLRYSKAVQAAFAEAAA